jgi:hypothetical protein
MNELVLHMSSFHAKERSLLEIIRIINHLFQNMRAGVGSHFQHFLTSFIDLHIDAEKHQRSSIIDLAAKTSKYCLFGNIWRTWKEISSMTDGLL